MAPEMTVASVAATSVELAPATETWHQRGASPSAAAAPPGPPPSAAAAAAATASMNMVTGMLPPDSAAAGAATDRSAAARPFRSAVASFPSPSSTHDTCAFHSNAALYVNPCAHAAPGCSGEAPRVRAEKAQWCVAPDGNATATVTTPAACAGARHSTLTAVEALEPLRRAATQLHGLADIARHVTE
jgi:hypothetical protein